MSEETKFFFEFTENSTELYREAHKVEDFSFKSFFEEPASCDLFVEVEVGPCDEEDLFAFEQKFTFPSHIGNKFVRLISESSQKFEKSGQSFL